MVYRFIFKQQNLTPLLIKSTLYRNYTSLFFFKTNLVGNKVKLTRKNKNLTKLLIKDFNFYNKSNLRIFLHYKYLISIFINFFF